MKPIINIETSLHNEPISIRVDTLESEPIVSITSKVNDSVAEMPLDVALLLNQDFFTRIGRSLELQISNKRKEKYYPSRISKRVVQDPVNHDYRNYDCFALKRDNDKTGYLIPYLVWRGPDQYGRRSFETDGWSLHLTGLSRANLGFAAWDNLIGIKELIAKMTDVEALKLEAQKTDKSEYEGLLAIMATSELLEGHEWIDDRDSIRKIALENPNLYPSLDRLSIEENPHFYSTNAVYNVRFYAPRSAEAPARKGFLSKFDLGKKIVEPQEPHILSTPEDLKKHTDGLSATLKDGGWNLLSYHEQYPIFHMLVSKFTQEEVDVIDKGLKVDYMPSRPKISGAEFRNIAKSIMEDLDSI